MNALEAAYKPGVICLFPVMYHEPLQSWFHTFLVKRVSPVSLVSLTTLAAVHLMILLCILILADCLVLD